MSHSILAHSKGSPCHKVVTIVLSIDIGYLYHHIVLILTYILEEKKRETKVLDRDGKVKKKSIRG